MATGSGNCTPSRLSSVSSACRALLSEDANGDKTACEAVSSSGKSCSLILFSFAGLKNRAAPVHIDQSALASISLPLGKLNTSWVILSIRNNCMTQGVFATQGIRRSKQVSKRHLLVIALSLILSVPAAYADTL